MTESQGERDYPSKFAHYIGKELMQTICPGSRAALNLSGAGAPEQKCDAWAHKLLAPFGHPQAARLAGDRAYLPDHSSCLVDAPLVAFLPRNRDEGLGIGEFMTNLSARIPRDACWEALVSVNRRIVFVR